MNSLIESLQNAAARCSEGVLITDRSQRVVYANPAFCRQSGFSSSELLGHRAPDLGDEGEEILPKQLPKGPFRRNFTRVHRDMSTYVAGAYHIPFVDESGARYCLAIERELQFTNENPMASIQFRDSAMSLCSLIANDLFA